MKSVTILLFSKPMFLFLDTQPCMGALATGSCCTPAEPCAVNQGDCDADPDCQGNLICGEDNCNLVGSGFPSNSYDCCVG